VRFLALQSFEASDWIALGNFVSAIRSRFNQAACSASGAGNSRESPAIQRNMDYDVILYAVWPVEGFPPDLLGAEISRDENAQKLAREIAEADAADRAQLNPLSELTGQTGLGIAYSVEDVPTFEKAVEARNLRAQPLD
jgi:hypothetical protein